MLEISSLIWESWDAASCNACLYTRFSFGGFTLYLCDYIHDDVIKWKHFPRYCPFVWEIHRSPVNSPRKGHWHGYLMFSLICAWTDSWANNGDAGDLRHYRAHYDVIVMFRGLSVLYTVGFTPAFLLYELDFILWWNVFLISCILYSISMALEWFSYTSNTYIWYCTDNVHCMFQLLFLCFS